MKSRHVLIIGAGAAGLAAAGKLVSAGLDVTVLDARNRIGGRIHTIRGTWPVPVEAGPEFIHGEIPEFDSLLSSAGVTTVEIPEKHWQFIGGKLEELDFGSAWEKVFKQLQQHSGPDQSFASFLDRRCGHLSAEERTAAIEYVEGFNAADSSRISIEWLRKTESELGAGSESGILRVTSGYDQILKVLADRAQQADIRLNSRVSKVYWQTGKILMTSMETGASKEYTADCAVVTLPLSVLKAASAEKAHVLFSPDLPEKWQAIGHIEMGAVIKAVLRFKTPFWQEFGAQAGFLHIPGAHFMTWWPLGDEPFLTGWCGGPRAKRLSTNSDESIRETAIVDLAQGLAMQERELRKLLVDGKIFNWQRDPFALGTYSYVAVGGAEAFQRLAEPVANTLFFAGEATAGAQAATVAGATASGYRAANEILSISG